MLGIVFYGCKNILHCVSAHNDNGDSSFAKIINQLSDHIDTVCYTCCCHVNETG